MSRDLILFLATALAAALAGVAIWVLPFQPSTDQMLFIARVFGAPVLILMGVVLAATAIHRRRHPDR